MDGVKKHSGFDVGELVFFNKNVVMLWSRPESDAHKTVLCDIIESGSEKFALVLCSSSDFYKILIDKSVGWVSSSCLDSIEKV